MRNQALVLLFAVCCFAAAYGDYRYNDQLDEYSLVAIQARSYKLGQLKFRELHDRAQARLGPKFAVKRFHDEMLSGGVLLPLDLLDSRTNSWIQDEKK
ncbi:MAG TPA: DUF885 family protein [Steroidobacteraceae bacterium]|jgi:uncharacterized protein (DUF885 family)|nr:DUF885 family protein [Steroidobacteraceae bacterium]